MERKLRISNKQFEEFCKLFGEFAKIDIGLQIPTDKDVVERIGDTINYNIDKMIKSLIEEYKRSPFKKKSAFTSKLNMFRNIYFLRDYRLSYQFEDNVLVFKQLVRYQSRFKRITKNTILLNV